jgi:hypothetical protein
MLAARLGTCLTVDDGTRLEMVVPHFHFPFLPSITCLPRCISHLDPFLLLFLIHSAHQASYSVQVSWPVLARFARLNLAHSLASKIASGHVLDYAPGKCIDDNKDVRCTKPFLVTKSTCYEVKWSTDGALSHTTAEFRDAASNEIVYYRDTDGQWTPEKGEVSFLISAPAAPEARWRVSSTIYGPG